MTIERVERIAYKSGFIFGIITGSISGLVIGYFIY